MTVLTPRQAAFVREYLVDLNATQAAIRAGYSAKTAEQQGSRLLRYAQVASAVEAGQAARSEKTGVTAEKVLAHLWEIATADPNELVQYRRGACEACWGAPEAQDEAMEPQGHGGALRRSRKAPVLVLDADPNPDCAQCGGEGVGRAFVPDTRTLKGSARRLYAGVRVTRDGLQVQMRSQDGALALLFDHLGLSAPRRSEVSGPNGQPIETKSTEALGKLPRAKRDEIRAAIKAALKESNR